MQTDAQTDGCGYDRLNSRWFIHVLPAMDPQIHKPFAVRVRDGVDDNVPHDDHEIQVNWCSSASTNSSPSNTHTHTHTHTHRLRACDYDHRPCWRIA